MLEETSIQRQLQRDLEFQPPYCPNAQCRNHEDAPENFWFRHGSKRIKRFPYRALKYCCKNCKKVFTGSCFKIHYRQKRWDGNLLIFKEHRKGVSKREIARELGCSERMVRRRMIRLARWCLLKHAKFCENLQIREPIVYDGLENFSYSQFDPNNVNHAVGKESLFTYDFNFCPLNRKGRLSEAQVLKLRELDKKYGRYPKNVIRTSTKSIFERLFAKSQDLVIYSDRHFQYRRVLELDMPTAKILHLRTSSKVVRNYRNPLFAVNNIDMQARHNLAAFKRETIAFAKHSVAMMESFVLYMAYRNYMRPKFWGTHRSDPLCSIRSPAMELKIAPKIFKFDEFFSERVPRSHVQLNDDWAMLYARIDPLSRRKIA
jgi:hypothetical protein